MKKILSVVFALLLVLGTIPVFAVSAAGARKDNSAATDIQYSDHLTSNSKSGYDYDLTGSVIAWVKQAKGALVWVTADDARGDDAIIAQAMSGDPSLANAVKQFAVLKGEGVMNTPNTNGSQAVVTVYTDSTGKLIMSIDGAYSHFVSGTPVGGSGSGSSGTVDPPENPGTVTDPVTDPVIDPAAGESDVVSIRIDTPRKMAVNFPDDAVYYDGDIKEVVVGREYAFQMVSVNWETGLYDENGNGICGTVVYRMKAVHAQDFNELRKEALKDPARYTVKGIDIIDNDNKTITVNCDVSDAHLETDVNNFFIAYRFHFNEGDYNKQTGIKKVLDNPLESLSVNLPIGTTVTCDAYMAYQLIDTDNVFITRNNGEGEYADEFLASVNDYRWNY